MDCGIPFCHNGCPLGNLIPEWNDLVWKDDFREASERLHATNNFPEFTGRLCPAPCEAACVLGINDDPVTIKQVEVEIADRPGARAGPRRSCRRRRPASGSPSSAPARPGWPPRSSSPAPATTSSCWSAPTASAGCCATASRVQDGEVGPGPPPGADARRGHEFRTGVDVGVDVTVEQLREEYDAVLLAGGSTLGRDLPPRAASSAGIHLAMEYLVPSNRVQEGDLQAPPISAEGKDVVIIGGGDTGADCLGTRSGRARVDHPARDHAAAAAGAPRLDAVADLAAVYRRAARTRRAASGVFSVNTQRFVGEDGR
jgi:glutamate synthase (NADPH/NADH) small chain